MLEKKNLEKLTKQARKPLKKSERIKRKRKVFLLYSFFAIVLVALYQYLLLSPYTAFTSFTLTDSELSNKIEKERNELLVKRFISIFPYNSFLTPTLLPVQNEIKKTIPEIESIRISRSVMKKSLDISYVLRKPIFITASSTYIDSNNNEYFDDRKPILPLFHSEKPITNTDLQKLMFLKETIEIALLQIDEVNIDALSDVTFLLHNDLKTKIKFSLNQNEKEVWSKIVSALDTPPLKENKDSFNKILYLDIRFGNKIYYKIIKEEKIGSLVGTSTIESTTTSITASTTYGR